MTSHYESRDIKLRCDGEHEWGEPYLEKGNTDVVYEDGEVYLKITWTVRKSCQKDYTNNVKNVYQTCQREKTVDRGSKVVPIDEL